MCALDKKNEAKPAFKRLPSPHLARQIAEALPAPVEIKHSLVEHMELAHVEAVRARYEIRELYAHRQVSEALSDLRTAHQQAVFGTDLSAVHRSYRVLRDAAATLLPHLSPEIYPASFAQTCLYLHDALCVLDRADQALLYARLASRVLEDPDVYEPGFTREQVDDLEINSIRGVAVAYHNLGLNQKSSGIYDDASNTSAYRNAGDFWKPLVGRDILNAMVEIPHFSIRKANKLAYDIERICERRGDEFTLLLVRESWLRCLIQHRKWKLAQRIYQEEVDRIPRLPYIGSLHRALLLKSGALLAWELKDMATWQERVGDALNLMQLAGLSHQTRTVKQIYGPRLVPVLDYLDLSDG